MPKSFTFHFRFVGSIVSNSQKVRLPASACEKYLTNSQAAADLPQASETRECKGLLTRSLLTVNPCIYWNRTRNAFPRLPKVGTPIRKETYPTKPKNAETRTAKKSSGEYLFGRRRCHNLNISSHSTPPVKAKKA